MTQLVFEKRISSAWIAGELDPTWPEDSTFTEVFQFCIDELHSWPALIVGCHLDETTPLAEFFVIEGGVHAEYRLREAEGND